MKANLRKQRDTTTDNEQFDLKVRYKLEANCSCNSEYMLGAIDCVGVAIRAAFFYWVPKFVTWLWTMWGWGGAGHGL